jgi:hypothetical protein
MSVWLNVAAVMAGPAIALAALTEKGERMMSDNDNKPPHEVCNHATYLGDGLYADFDGYNVEIFASNGIIRTNRVFLEPCVLETFLRWVEALKKGPANGA